MNSKRALEEWYGTISVNDKIRWENNYLSIKKDLEILECFKKIPKQDLKEFIEWQLRYEKMIKNWLDERPFLYVDKENPTKHLIKIKEWLEK